MFKKIAITASLLAVSNFCNAGLIYLDGDTVATGSTLGNSSLSTSFGNIDFQGEFRVGNSDAEFIAAGSTGNVFDIDNSSRASFIFDFDVSSFSFIFGGNSGVFDIVAKNSIGVIVDSFFQPSTDTGEFAGPLTLAGSGIRSIEWQDPGFSFAPIDNITIVTTSVPEPSSIALLLAGLISISMRKAKLSK